MIVMELLMEVLTPILVFLIGLLVRFAIPVVVTIGFILLLKRLDERWQEQAKPMLERGQASNPGCWKMMNCSEENILQCSAYAHSEIPCWQHFREKNNGLLQERCLGCKVFNEAPVPIPA